MLLSQQRANQDANGLHIPASALGRDTASNGDRWAAQKLAVDGEEVLGKVHLPQYLLLSRILLTTPLGEHTNICWGLVCVYICLVGLMTGDCQIFEIAPPFTVTLQQPCCIRHVARCMFIMITAFVNSPPRYNNSF